MKNEAQIRILLLQQYLCTLTDEEHAASVSDILQFWESHGIQAGRKSVYSDIQILIDQGVDVVCVKSTQNRYFVGSRLFELPELKLLVDAVESSHFITRKKSASLIRKLVSLTSQEQAKQLNRPVYMEGTAKQDNEAIYYAVDMIHTAIQEKRRIAFQYIEYTAEKEKVLKHDGYRYEFSPYALIWSRDYYYAVGWSEKHGKLAQFRVDRMTAVKLLVQEAIPAQDFDPAAYVHQVFGMFGADIQRITLLCENSTMRSVVDRFGEEVQAEIVDGEHFQATVDVAPSPPFFAWVFTFGGKIRIMEPEEIAAKMREMAMWLQ